MKKAMVSILFLAMVFSISAPAFAQQVREDMKDRQIFSDVLFMRPLGLAATVIGSAVFVLSLPFAIPSRSVEAVAQRLVVDPAKFTFTRPIGEFDSYIDQY
ncbi:MAG TPA: hypothetical protein VLS90_03490 [Thermodesulfobacteriota bacterium]|nr:hypothetical protein [Thermodesulfobacteriota bacterium]